MRLIRTNSENPNFQALVQLLDKELADRYGEEQKFFDQFNKVNTIRQIILAYIDDIPVGCGAIKEYSNDTTEVKRMFVKPEFRNKGIARQILHALEVWARKLNFYYCILETGKGQPEAIHFYKKNGYAIIENYGQYKGVDTSVCMKKEINLSP